jgi:uncharacterized protein YbjQ (UPF0145 family)
MWRCPKCNEELDDSFDTCWKCANDGVEADAQTGSDLPDISDVMLVTVPEVPGRRVVETLGVVSGEAIIGANVFNERLVCLLDIVGGRAGLYESILQGAREIALAEMGQGAKERGGNCVLGIKIDYVSLRGTMLMVAATGTAARIDREGTD